MVNPPTISATRTNPEPADSNPAISAIKRQIAALSYPDMRLLSEALSARILDHMARPRFGKIKFEVDLREALFDLATEAPFHITTD